jgi:hypothetical protein
LNQIDIVAGDRLLDARAATMARRDVSGSVKFGDGVRQIAHQPRIQLARLRELIEKVGLGETTHLHHPVDNGPAAIESQIATDLPGDCANPDVEGRGCAEIEVKLLLQKTPRKAVVE